jgi:hypothetical protein
MKLPTAEEYLEIIGEKAPGTLATLQQYRFLTEKDSKTLVYERSRRNIVFKAEYHSKLYAIRFFLNDDHELFRRYRELQNYLEARQLSWKLPFEFLHEEYYPVLKMDWVQGDTFTNYLNSIINNPTAISELQSKLLWLSNGLEKNNMAHGNLNMKHIRVQTIEHQPILKLIDYDSMFIPSFREKDSLTAGTSSFQHPMRLASDFSQTIDRFSFWVFLTALEAFKIDASLWTKATEHGYDQSKQVLFNYRDLAIPQQSRAFQIIRSYNNDALNFYADKLVAFCSNNSLEAVELPQLYSKSGTTPLKAEAPLPELKTRQAEPIQQPVEKTEEKPVKNIIVVQKPKVEIPAPKIETPAPKSVLLKRTEQRDQTVEKKEFIPAEVAQKQSKTYPIPLKKSKTPQFILIIAVIATLAFVSIYFIKAQNHPEKVQPETPITSQIKNVQPVVKPAPQDAVFTTTNITQFLFGLYQSYNKRDLPAILSNYSDNLNRYYDAGAVTKNKLGEIIHDLFIKPSYYECHPDIRTLQSTVRGDSCKLSIAVTETIKADRRSKKEDYSSKIEYTIDRSFKILSEKNVE